MNVDAQVRRELAEDLGGARRARELRLDGADLAAQARHEREVAVDGGAIGLEAQHALEEAQRGLRRRHGRHDDAPPLREEGEGAQRPAAHRDPAAREVAPEGGAVDAPAAVLGRAADGDHLVAEDVVGVGGLARERGLPLAAHAGEDDAHLGVAQAARVHEQRVLAREEHGPDDPEHAVERVGVHLAAPRADPLGASARALRHEAYADVPARDRDEGLVGGLATVSGFASVCARRARRRRSSGIDSKRGAAACKPVATSGDAGIVKEP